jgi:hypothetical protein
VTTGKDGVVMSGTYRPGPTSVLTHHTVIRPLVLEEPLDDQGSWAIDDHGNRSGNQHLPMVAAPSDTRAVTDTLYGPSGAVISRE